MKTMIKLYVLVVFIVMSGLGALNAVYASTSSLTLLYQVGSANARIDNNDIKTTKPAVVKNDIYIPLRTTMDAFGAEVNYNGKGKINILYRDRSIDLKIGDKQYVVNQNSKLLSAVPLMMYGTTMVPVSFISQNFQTKVTTDVKKGTVKIVLEDDGALSDLSFLTDSIGKAKVGNSYFGWDINIPKGSRITYNAFNSKDVDIQNEHRQMTLQVHIESVDGKSMTEVFEEISQEPEEIIDGDLIDQSLNTQANPAYLEFLYNSTYDEAAIHRVFVNSKYIYHITITSGNETDPKKLKKIGYVKSILDSFKMNYTGTDRATQDLSKVKFGYTRFDNYTSFSNGNKYLSWGMDVLPEWDVLNLPGDDLLNISVGRNKNEYIHVSVKKSDDENSDPELVGEEKKNFYDEYFNKDLYKFISKANIKLAGFEMVQLVYTLNMGKATYRCEEHYVILDGLLYCITINLPDEKYKTQKDTFYKLVETFEPFKRDQAPLLRDMEAYNFENEKKQVGKNGDFIEYKNKEYTWGMELPGNWAKESNQGGAFEFFSMPDTGVNVVVESVENNSKNKDIPDHEKFRFMGSLINRKEGNITQKRKEMIEEKNTKINHYVYKVDIEDEDIFGEVEFYIVNRDKYSYCFTTIIPDISKSKIVLETIRRIWTTFNAGNEKTTVDAGNTKP